MYTLLLEMENATAMGWVLPDTPAGTQVQLSTPALGGSQPPGTLVPRDLHACGAQT